MTSELRVLKEPDGIISRTPTVSIPQQEKSVERRASYFFIESRAHRAACPQRNRATFSDSCRDTMAFDRRRLSLSRVLLLEPFGVADPVRRLRRRLSRDGSKKAAAGTRGSTSASTAAAREAEVGGDEQRRPAAPPRLAAPSREPQVIAMQGVDEWALFLMLKNSFGVDGFRTEQKSDQYRVWAPRILGQVRISSFAPSLPLASQPSLSCSTSLVLRSVTSKKESDEAGPGLTISPQQEIDRCRVS